MSEPAPPFDLLVITDPAAPRGLAPYLEALASEAQGWALVLRDHGASDASLARSLETLSRASRGTPCLLAAQSPSRVELAIAAGAGVLLPERGPSAALARGRVAWVAASIHDEAGAARRAREGAQLLVLAPFGAVPGKGPPLADSEVVTLTTREGSPPIFGLGGLRDVADMARAFRLGCRGVAVRAPMATADDGARTLQSLCEAVRRARTERDPAPASG